MAGRFQLVQSVYQSLFLHCFSIYQLPSCVLKHLSACARNFIWLGDLSSRKLVTVDWSMVCGPKKEGGLDLRDLASLNLTALLSFGWDALQSCSLWGSFARQRFPLSPYRNQNVYLRSSVWHGLKRALPILNNNSRWIIGDGRSVSFWFDKWLDEPITSPSLFSVISPKVLPRVSYVIEAQSWSLP